MGDTAVHGHDDACLFGVASEQHGYFTAKQARGCGVTFDHLSYHAQRGRFIRVRRGLYRLRDYPSFPREDVVAAWPAVGKKAVVSHESALDLLDLSDVIPNAVHLTVPRSTRHLPTLVGATIHTSTRPFQPADLITRDGIRLTSASRTILDAAQSGVGPEPIEMAVRQALRRGLTTSRRLEQDARGRSQRVYRLVTGALQQSPA
jgi:predicted transcriptional regulator of viral defense system